MSLVICDVNMPNMDGITFVKTLKNDAKYASVKFVPVIVTLVPPRVVPVAGESEEIVGVPSFVLKLVAVP